MKKLIFFQIIILVTTLKLYSQPFPFNCGSVEADSTANKTLANPFRGVYKPVRTDYNGERFMTF